MLLRRKIKKLFTGSPYTRKEQDVAVSASLSYLNEAVYWRGTDRAYPSDEELLALPHTEARKKFAEFYLRRRDNQPLWW